VNTAAGPLENQPVDVLARAVIAAVRTEYPHRLQQELRSDADLLPPRVLNPSFYGSYDWHSAVHGHWTLVRCLGLSLSADVAAEVTAVLDEHLAPERVTGELEFFSGPGGLTSERPYGWAWLVLLHAECRRATGTGVFAAAGWADALEPLALHLRAELLTYLESTLAFPIRTGTHSNTAFAVQVVLQASAALGDIALAERVRAVAARLYGADGPLQWTEPPSGDAFLAPPLVEAALMADVLGPDGFEDWFARVSEAQSPTWPVPAFTPNGPDPGTVHLEGLLVSRAWCLHAVAQTLRAGSPIADAALAARNAHLVAVAGIDPNDGFNRAHWLPTFLVYLDAWIFGSL
jgi:hypothetical protein